MRVFVGAVFIYSGWGKLTVPIENFAAVIEGYRAVTPSLIPFIAHVFPWAELILGTFLVLGFLTRASAGGIAAMLAIFVALLARSLFLKLPIFECGCFGSGITLSPHQALFFDIGLWMASLVIVIRPVSRFSLDRRLHEL
ncbi:MAG: DoxX family membrane protein [Candidatus Omnitrophica bacterium]|nr:DoxX family membrane protein [Candidatus Omnitrophota bacterium]